MGILREPLIEIMMEHKVDSFEMESKILKDFMTLGPTWSNSVEMQKEDSEKGWKVKVFWEMEYEKEDCLGLGLFADEPITKGTILRRGVFGKNLLVFDSEKNLPMTEVEATVEYLRNYAVLCPCGGEHMIIWLPGCGCNHSTTPNLRPFATADGIDIIATADILKGQSLRADYRLFGKAPKWFLEILAEKTGNTECVFPGQNDYVNRSCDPIQF